MKVIVLEKEREVFSMTSALSVILPSESGEICVHPGHMSIITLMQKGVIRINYTENNIQKTHDIEIVGGVFSFKDNEAVFLVQLS